MTGRMEVVRLDVGKVYNRCIDRGLSRAELLRNSQISQKTMEKAVAGKPIAFRSARKVAEALDCALSDIIGSVEYANGELRNNGARS